VAVERVAAGPQEPQGRIITAAAVVAEAIPGLVLLAGMVPFRAAAAAGRGLR
jgi:hypothetical protein